jgi:hypothetical protein
MEVKGKNSALSQGYNNQNKEKLGTNIYVFEET